MGRALTAMVTVSLGCAGLACAGDLGDPAPPLHVSTWVKGAPVDVTAGRGEKIYIIEFWAPWCQVCRQCAPLLSRVQDTYRERGVVIVAIAQPKEKPEVVQTFVAEMGEKLTYAVALDDDGQTWQAYMGAFGFELNDVPHVFVIDREGRLIWHDVPQRLPRILDRIVAGEFDVETARKLMAEREQVRARYRQAQKLRFVYYSRVSRPGSAEKARATGEEFLRLAHDNPGLVNDFSWEIMTHRGIADRDLDLAKKAAKLAYDGCEGQDPAIVDTYARAFFETGQIHEAIQFQRRAVELCEDPVLLRDLKSALRRYERAAAEAPPVPPTPPIPPATQPASPDRE